MLHNGTIDVSPVFKTVGRELKSLLGRQRKYRLRFVPARPFSFNSGQFTRPQGMVKDSSLITVPDVVLGDA